MCRNPAKIFGLKNKGDIAIGCDADLVILDFNDCYIIQGGEKNIMSKCGWTPYEGMKTGGRVLKTFVRGSIVYSFDDNCHKFFGPFGKEVEYKNNKTNKNFLE